jgi:hypothetical protein
LAKSRAQWTYPSRQVSDHEGQFGERVGETSRRSDIGPEVVEAPAKVLDEGVPADDHPGGSITLQPSHRSEARLERPVVGLERIVGVDLRVVEGGREQLIEDAWVDPYRSVVTSVGKIRVRPIAWAKSLLAASVFRRRRGRRR